MTTHIHSRAFKLQVVREELRGAKRLNQLCREYGISARVLCKWRKAYAERGEAAFATRQAGAEAPEEQTPEQRLALSAKRLYSSLRLSFYPRWSGKMGALHRAFQML